MRDLTQLDHCRQRDGRILEIYGSYGDDGNGVFNIHCPSSGRSAQCIASNGEGWDHVSVSISNRCPNWFEMEHIKLLFFKDDETAMQLHVPPVDHINKHPNCLHLWRPNDGRDIPRPPPEFVG
jgi:hypothetical protein